MKQKFIILLILMGFLVTACSPEPTQPTNPTAETSNMVNPASQFCVARGYQSEIRDEADGQVGYCLFPDGSECEEWAYYRGECTPAGESQPIPTPEPTLPTENNVAPSGATIEPLIEELCNGQAQAMSHTLDDLIPTVTEEPLEDPITGASGTGCQSTITGTRVQFESPLTVVNALGGMLEDQGWTADPIFVADGPTGTAAGYRLDDQICLVTAMWAPDESANCPDDQPITACEVTPEQQTYTISLNCGVVVPGEQASTMIPFIDALGDLEPQDVFQNFYDITQVPRPSGHMEQIQAFLVNFGQGLALETIMDEAGNIIIRKPASPGMENRKGVVLQAHMDMVPTKDTDLDFEFTTDPIQAFVSGDNLIAKGTTLGADDGIGMAMIMAVLQSETIQAGPIEGLFTVNEETDMSGAFGLKEDVLQGKILINLDSEWDGVFLIGAAGGGHISVSADYPQVPSPAGMAAYQVEIQGLKGGHSGVDINLGRGHAIKLLVRLLKGAVEPYEVLLASLIGGNASNAIPREAAAVVLLPEEQTETFSEYVQNFEATIKSELSAVEPDLSIELVEVQPPTEMIDQDLQMILLDALYATPQGVIRMSDALPGLVETSNNLGVVAIQDGQIQVDCTPRSSVDSALDDVSQMVASVWELAGYEVELANYYPGWNPNPESPILQLMKATYQELYGKAPEVMAVHAGLECGMIGGKYLGMDMISIGPTLNDVHSPSEQLLIPTVGHVMDLLLAVLENIPEK